MRTTLCITSMLMALSCSLPSIAQFRGGAGDGVALAIRATAPLGVNIFKGGNDDGFSSFRATSQSLGVNIFKGGIDDGFSSFRATSQPLGLNIFKGGTDDGFSSFRATNQLLGINIFKGGIDDGFSSFRSTSQPLGANIYYGGANDGWAMAFKGNNILNALPVTLLDFSGQWQQNNALLTWATSSETNSDHFELQRSFDANYFTPVGTVAAAGTSTSLRSYQYLDINIKLLLPPSLTNVYYRLLSVDKDGKSAYSGVIVLRADRNGITTYAIYPNPASSIITIAANGMLPSSHTLVRIYDVSGRVVLQQNLIDQKQQLPVSGLSNGSYFLQLTDGSNILYTQKIIIQK